MEMHQLRYAAEVHRRGSFTAAAEALHISQSGVSAQVAKLESSLGVRIFDRGARSVSLTGEGDVMMPRILQALAATERVRTVADEIAGVVRGRVRVGTVIGCAIDGYLEAFARFRQAYPGVEISAREANSDALIAALSAGDLDVAIVGHAGPLPPDLLSVIVIEEPIVALARSDRVAAPRGSISVAAIANDTVLTLPRGTGIRAAFDRTCRAAGVTTAPAVEAHSPEAVLALAERGAGVAILSASMAPASLTAIPIVGAAHASLSLAHRPDPSAAARAFIRLVREHLAVPDGQRESGRGG